MRSHLVAALAFALAAAAGCTGQTGLSSSDIDQMDKACAMHADATTCHADTSDQCTWIAYGRPCQVGQPCVSGVCQGPIAGGGTVVDGGTASCSSGTSPCSTLTDSASCMADTGDRCRWYATGVPCQQGQPCPGGVCQAEPDPACQSQDGGTVVHQGCACPNGGVCVENVDAAGHVSPIQCLAQNPCGSSNPCACLVGATGACTPSPDVTGLCLCQPSTQPQPAGCTCSSGQTCFEQVGGPAVQADAGQSLGCFSPPSGCAAGDCSCITGQGRCAASQQTPGLCECDNGIR